MSRTRALGLVRKSCIRVSPWKALCGVHQQIDQESGSILSAWAQSGCRNTRGRHVSTNTTGEGYLHTDNTEHPYTSTKCTLWRVG